jgi:glycosyltransferase involved in cell wall biosynthesis
VSTQSKILKQIKEQADVSIVSANYNNGLYLDEFLKSIILSTVEPRELIIVDDGSTDASLKILGGYSDLSFLKIIELKNNLGFANALNIGINQSIGKFIMRVDPDDLIEPKRIFIQYHYLQEHSEIDVVGSNMLYISGNKDVLFKSNMPLQEERIKELIFKGEIAMFNGSIMGKSDVFKTNLYDQTYVPAEDYDFISRLVLNSYRLVNLPQKLTLYRMHKFNSSDRNLMNVYQKIAILRAANFKINTSKHIVLRNYLHTKYYRMFLKQKNFFLGYLYLFIAVMIRPSKLIKRLII